MTGWGGVLHCCTAAVHRLIVSWYICRLWFEISIIGPPLTFSHLKSYINLLLTSYKQTVLLTSYCQCNVYGKTSLCKCFYLFSRFCILHDLSKLHADHSHSPVSILPTTRLKSVFHEAAAGSNRLFKPRLKG